jgi:uncharacterized protein with PIN domain
MPQNNSEPNSPAGDAALDVSTCPKCAAEMERIQTSAEGPQVEELLLCPKCYLVTWRDQDGIHVRQGVAMNRGDQRPPAASPWMTGDPKDC